MTNSNSRRPVGKHDIVIYAEPDDYASFPQLARTDDELVLLFQVQDLAKLHTDTQHPH